MGGEGRQPDRIRAAVLACPVLAGMPPAVLDATVRAAWLRRLATGEALFRTGDPGDAMFVVASGRIASRITTAKGDVADVAVAPAGELIGHLDVVDRGRRNCDAVAVRSGEVVVIGERAAERILQESPATLRAIASDLVRIIRLQVDAASERAFEPAPVRLATLLLATADADGLVEFDGPQALVAQRLGITRQTLNRSLHALAARDLLRLRPGGRTVTVDRDALSAFVGANASVRSSGVVATATATRPGN